MSSDKDPYWELKNGGMEKGGDKVVPADGAEYLPRKRLRSSGSYTDESVNSAETSPKKAKVQNDSSFELSEKVQNNHQDNGDSELKNASDLVNTKDITSDVIKEDQSDLTAAENLIKSDNNILSSKPEEFFRKSVKQQVQEVANDLGMQTNHTFVKPPGYKYNPGQVPESGDYEVSLSLIRGEISEDFSGRGTTPYEAIRVAYKMAKEYLANQNGVCWTPKRKIESGTESGNCTIGGEEEDEEVVKDTDNCPAGNGDTNERKENLNGHGVKDSEDDSEGSDVGEEQEQPKWVHSLENFWDKALASKYPTISVNYSDMDQQMDEHVVECSIGKLVVEGTGSTKGIAREKAAQYMFSMIETILENEGTHALKKNIIEGEDSEEAPASYSSFTQPPFKDETAVDTIDDDETYDDEEEENEEVTASRQDPSPQKHPEPAGLAPYSPVQPGAEYCLALARVDMPQEKPMLLDVANMPRRIKAGMANTLISSLKEGEYSDDEDQEGGRMLDLMSQIITMSSQMPDRIKQKAVELFNRSVLGQMRPALPLPGMSGMIPGAGYGQQYHQLYQQQSSYPGLQAGYPGGAYPNQKARLLAGQVAAPPQPPPPKPIQPLTNLCQYPMPGTIEGVGSVTVTLEDYKTLQVGTFLNDVIIDFYMKYLQFTKLSDVDKNRVHIFTTFWFSRLTNKPSPIEARKDPVQRRYDRVKRWTRKVNIFEKDFVVVPINENYHWYLCIICYPGMVGCEDMQSNTPCNIPVRQKSRRRKKDKIKVLRSKMNAKPRKDESDERDEPLASEDEIEHEDDSLDVELWKRKVVEWEKQEEIRKEEERLRMVELERQRREWEERRREYEEQQRKLYEEQQRRYEEQQQRLAMEQEEMGDEEENWDDEEKYDEDGNPIDEKYDEYGELISDRYDEFGEPLSYDDGGLDEREDYCEKGGFADGAKYRTSVEMMAASDIETPIKARAMAAEWDDWGDDDDEQEMPMDQDISTDMNIEGTFPNCSSSLVAHTAPLVNNTGVSSLANQLHTTHKMVVKDNNVGLDVVDDKFKLISSLVCHSVGWTNDSEESHNGAIVEKLVQDKLALSANLVEMIPQVDGIVDEDGSDDEIGKEESSNNEDSKQNNEFEGECNKKDDNDDVRNVDDVIDTANGEAVESGMSTDEEIVMQQSGLVGYADTGDDSDTMPDTTEMETSCDYKVYKEDAPTLAEESSSDAIPELAEKIEIKVSDKGDEQMDVNVEGEEQMDANDEGEERYDSSETEEYEDEEKQESSHFYERQSDSEIEEVEEVEVAEKRSSDHENEISEEVSERSESESEESESEDEDISSDVPVKQPCILVFDSLGGKKDRQARLCATLRDFLSKEFEEKNPGQTREFSTRTMPGAAPRVPQQPNLTDCGLFLCHNVETFFKNPIRDYTMPITSLSSWFPKSESRMKRRDVAGIIKTLATQQNQDKLEQLQLPDLVFVEPEREARPSQRFERANSPGSDGDNMDDYNSEEDYEEEDDQRNSDRYSSSPHQKSRVTTRDRKETFSSEEADSEDDDRKRSNERRQKRYRSDDSGSDDDRKSRHQKRRSERDSSSDSGKSEDDFDSSAVYGRRPVSLSSPMKRLPPGISISRTTDGSSSRPQQHLNRDNFPQGKAELTRRLPPGISISRSAASYEVETPSSPTVSMPISRPLLTSVIKDDVDDTNNVTIEDVSDCSDENEIFDLDEPAYKRTYLTNNIQRPTNTTVKGNVAETLFKLPPGVSISRGDTKVAETIPESKSYANLYDDDMDTEYESVTAETTEGVSGFESVTAETTEGVSEGDLLPSMVTHQVNTALIGTAGVSMVTHQIVKKLHKDPIHPKVPQYDGSNDPDSDDENINPESVAVNQDEDDIRTQVEDENQSVEYSVGSVEPVNNVGKSHELSTDDVDNIDNQGLEEGEEIYAEDASVPENQEDLKAGQEFKNEEFDDGSNLQNAEEIELDGGRLEEINAYELQGNLPTEESMDLYEPDLEQGAEDVDDSEDPGESSDAMHDANQVIGDEETIDGEDENLDTSGEVINEGEEIDNSELIDDSTEVYDETEALDNNQEDYGYEECEDDEMYEEEDYSYAYSQPPVKRAKMSPEAEVVLDSESEDDGPSPAQPASISSAPVPQQNMIHNQFQLQQALLAQQQQRSGYQQPQTHGGLLAQYQQYAEARQAQQYSQLQHQVQPHSTRKRKLESQALCIKDNRVYLRSFSQLPPAILGETQLKSQPDYKQEPSNPPFTNPYKPLPTPYQSTVGVHHFSANSYPHQEQKVLQERIRQLPPGIMVQRKGIPEVRRRSVEDDDYHSDEPEEIIDGQEVEDDLDVIDDQSNKEFYSEDEESCEEVDVNDKDNNFEDDNSKDSNESENNEAMIGGHDKVSGDSHGDLEFEEAGLDVQEACEVFDKEEVHLQSHQTVEGTETSEKSGDLIEGEEVVEGDESQSGDVQKASASDAEMAE